MQKLILFLALACLIHLPRAHADSYTILVNLPFALLVNQLDQGSNTIDEIVPDLNYPRPHAFLGSFCYTPPAGLAPPYFTFAPGQNIPQTSNGLPDIDNIYVALVEENHWQPNSMDPIAAGWMYPNMAWHHGDGWIVENEVDGGSYTFTGTPRVPSGRIVNIPAGASALVGAETMTNGTYEIVIGAPPVEGSQVYRLNLHGYVFHFGPPDYSVYTFSNNVWSPQVPVLNIGEAAWFRAPPPALSVSLSNNNIVLSWPTNSAAFTLQSATQFNASNVWSTVGSPIIANGTLQTIILPLSFAENRFFRLQH